MPAKRSIKAKEITQQQKGNFFVVVHFTNHFRTYLLGRKFVIVTNHQALVWLYSFKDPEGVIAWWLEKLGQFDFTIKHSAGKDIPHADCLSRVQPEEEDTAAVIAALTFEKKTFKNNQRTLGCYSRTRTAESFRGSNKKIQIWRKFSHGSKINSDRTEGAYPGRLKNYGSIGSILRIFLSWMELYIGKKAGYVRNGCAATSCC